MPPGTFCVRGGVVAEIFRDLHKRTRFGGGSSRICSGSCRSISIKLPQLRDICVHFRETCRSPAISGDSRKFRET